MQRFITVMLALALVALIPFTGFLVLSHREKTAAPSSATLEAAREEHRDEKGTHTLGDGEKALKKLATASVDDVQAVLKAREEQKKNELKEQERNDAVEETIRRIQNGELSYRKVLSDLYVVGDSLMDGLRVYDILDSNHLVTKVSARLNHLEENFDKIVAMRPPILLMHYGLNYGTGEAQSFANRYGNLIDRLKEALPNTRLIVSLVFPVASSKQAGMGYIKDNNKALKQMCAEKNVEYLDSAPVFKGHDEYYGKDGEHLQKFVYSDVWLPHVIRVLEITA
ncbi:MAG: SGNH/GDSL hydrolase family protein [Clostridia bacterium]|nr:SGNH/GDSL hydrolase family protein [Clostridia bacterium]